MSLVKHLVAGVATTALAAAVGSAAWAQSTGTAAVEEVVITGGAHSVEGLMQREVATKSRSSIDQDYITTQVSGQIALQQLNSLPGVNFTNDDPYGSSGGNLRIRSFDKQRISLTLDGMPVNDTGNYQIYATLQPDGEIMQRISVNQGTTDVDSPTASATGGTISQFTRNPSSDFGIQSTITAGSFNYRRVLGMIDTGVIGPLGTTAWLEGSYQEYDKFRGAGENRKLQFNGKVYQPLWSDNWASVAFGYLRARNNSYRSASQADYLTFGNRYDNNIGVYRYDPPTAGVADNDGSGVATDLTSPASASNYYRLRINPTDTYNIRGRSLFNITDKLTLTVDPSFQFTLADGGSQSVVIAETDRRLIGTSAALGVDLNGDGDLLDSVRVMNPSVTNTRRYGLTSSLIWKLAEHHTLRGSYTLDYGRHRQTGEYSYIANGDFVDPFGGRDGHGPKIKTADGSYLQRRSRFSIATLNEFSGEYRGEFLDEKVVLNIGVRAPFFSRDLNQFCYYRATQIFGANEYCTTAPAGDPNIVGARAPFKSTVKYDKVLPNIGATWKPFGDAHQIYASYAQNLSAPRTDDLYDVQLPNVAPEETKAYDIGYRYGGGAVVASVALWKTDYQNRIVRAFNEDLGLSITRNLGAVNLYGLDGEISWKPISNLTLYTSASYIHSEVLNDVKLDALRSLPTKGKRLVETPEYTVFGRAQYEVANFTFGLQGKWVDDRFATDVNDEVAKAYTVLDLDVRYDMAGVGLPQAYVQLNVTNLLDEDYLGSISSGTNAKVIVTPGGPISPAVGFYQIGSPRAVSVSVHTEF